MLQGKQIYLANYIDGDAEYLSDWQWDEAFWSGMCEDVCHPYGVKEWTAMFENADSNDEITFTIRNIDDSMLIGFVSLSNILLRSQRAIIGIGIPQASDRQHGYGREALNLIIEYAFDHLNLHKLNLEVHSFNTSTIKLYEQLGFVREGVNREAIPQGGQWYDEYQYGLLASEWHAHQVK